MKAVILNSGMGKRMGEFTEETCKCLVNIADGVTILDAQLTLLLEAGITDICITTGAFADKLMAYVNERYPSANIQFVHNPVYDQTNYIYSLYLARQELDGEIILLHGDLVFEQNVLQELIAAPHSVMVTDTKRALPPKDFKAVVTDNKIVRIGIDEFSEGSRYAQPLYKLSRSDWRVWLDQIIDYCERGDTSVYAENAFNDISGKMHLRPLDLHGRECFEIDNHDDLSYGIKAYERIRPRQKFYEGFGSIHGIVKGAKRIFAVGDYALGELRAVLPENTVYFEDYTPNPDYNDVLKGVALFEAEKCDFIVSIGGGSALDVAKSINGFAVCNFGELSHQAAHVPHLAIPTTAGTGSESTHFAVIYKDGVKQSIQHQGLLPQYVILDEGFLRSLPDYHKKSTLLDALCQAIEAIWARDTDPTSRHYAMKAIPLILDNMGEYLSDNSKAAKAILQAANLAGRAINISKTTAAHAMSYKLSQMYNIAHGHAVALCLPHVWAHLIENENSALAYISEAFGVSSPKEALDKFVELFNGLALPSIVQVNPLAELVKSVNVQRMSNHPAVISDTELEAMYRHVIGGTQ
ncbi:MAG: iron-containing alcohol dehydrogenase [Defluviitaleaceae bacterium]|nr:iron-containing alcohol dehydrogenase [Defluviitaleaceae bacterium]